MQDVEEYIAIGGFLDTGLDAAGRIRPGEFHPRYRTRIDEVEKQEFRRVQQQANRWTYLGTGMTHERVLETLENLTPKARQRVESISAAFC